jgi:hypothetical protein
LGEEVPGESIDQVGVDERFISLDVDDMAHLGEGLRDFSSAIGSRRVIITSHRDVASKFANGIGNTIVIRGDGEVGEVLASKTPIPDMLHERLIGNVMERLSGKTG